MPSHLLVAAEEKRPEETSPTHASLHCRRSCRDLSGAHWCHGRRIRRVSGTAKTLSIQASQPPALSPKDALLSLLLRPYSVACVDHKAMYACTYGVAEQVTLTWSRTPGPRAPAEVFHRIADHQGLPPFGPGGMSSTSIGSGSAKGGQCWEILASKAPLIRKDALTHDATSRVSPCQIDSCEVRPPTGVSAPQEAITVYL